MFSDSLCLVMNPRYHQSSPGLPSLNLVGIPLDKTYCCTKSSNSSRLTPKLHLPISLTHIAIVSSSLSLRHRSAPELLCFGGLRYDPDFSLQPYRCRINVERGTLNVLDAASTDISPRLTTVTASVRGFSLLLGFFLVYSIYIYTRRMVCIFKCSNDVFNGDKTLISANYVHISTLSR